MAALLYHQFDASLPLFFRPPREGCLPGLVSLQVRCKERVLNGVSALYKARMQVSNTCISYDVEFVAPIVDWTDRNSPKLEALSLDLREYFITQLLTEEDQTALGIEPQFKWDSAIKDKTTGDFAPALYMEGSFGKITFMCDLDHNDIDSAECVIGDAEEFRFPPANQEAYWNWDLRRRQYILHSRPRIVECGGRRYSNQGCPPNFFFFGKSAEPKLAADLLQEAINKSHLHRYEHILFS